MESIRFITSNAAKVELAKERLKPYGVSVVQHSLALEEVQDLSVVQVARHKAQQALAVTTEPFFVEDSGFAIQAFKGFPGPFVKIVMTTVGDERLIRLFTPDDSREVEVVSVIAYGDPASGMVKTFEGSYHGFIADKPKGDQTRGWTLTKIFIPNGWNKTLAELDDAEWNRFLAEFRRNDHFDKMGAWLSDPDRQKT